MTRSRSHHPRGPLAVIEAALGRLAVAAHRGRGIVLIIALITTLVAAWCARSLTIDTDLTHLLPNTFESVQNLERFEQRAWGVGYVSVVVEGGDAAARRKVADELAPRLEQLSSIEYVDHKRPHAFFTDRALFYLDHEDLETIRDRIEERHVWEVRSRSSMYDLELEPLGDAPSLEFEELREKYAPMLARVGVDASGDPGAAQEPSAYVEDDTALVLLARPSRRSSDVGFNDRVVADVQAVVEAYDPSPHATGITLKLSGRYKKKAEQKKQIEDDLSLASLLALALVLVYLGFHFRRPAAVVLVMAPLVVGLVCTFGVAALVFGSLNLLTGFIGALLLGVGIDHGIHLMARIEEETRQSTPEEAVRRSFGTTGRAVVAAALTTTFAFLGVAVSEFRAFREFGIIAAVGLTTVVISYTTVLPALVAWMRPAKTKSQRKSPLAKALPRWAPVTGWCSLLAVIATIASIGGTRFDYDFASLESSDLPAFHLDARVNRLLGRSQTPLVIMADDVTHERAITEALRRHISEHEDTGLQMVMSFDDLVPREAAAKKAVIDEIGDTLENAKASWFDEEQNDKRLRLVRMAKLPPFGRAEMPVEAKRAFLGRDGQQSFVLAYPRVSLSDGAAVRSLAKELRSVRTADGAPLAVAGEAMVLADVLDMVVEEAPVIIGFTLALVVLVLLVLLGPRLVVPCASAAFTTLFATLGLMPHVGLELNYLNIVIIPVLFGMAVDGAVHMLVAFEQTRDLERTVSGAGRAVAGAILTTCLGFGAFTLAHHPGLRSLGAVAVLGLAVNLLVCLLLLPSALALWSRHRARPSSRRWTRFVVTTGWAGDAPFAPGTLGALVAVPLALSAQRIATTWQVTLVTIATLASVAIVARYLRHTGDKDPSEVVLDELVGCAIAILLGPAGAAWTVAAFVLFRLFDILKPWPIGFIDRRVRGAWGVMGDDVVAGLLAGASLLAVERWGLHSGWWS